MEQVEIIAKKIGKSWVILVGIIVAGLVASCSDTDPEIGSDFFDDVSFEVVTWDTVTMQLSTVQLDSMVTSSPIRLLLGKASHVDLGEITAEPYFQVGDNAITDFPVGADFRYLRTSLTLYFDHYYYGDTSQLMEIQIQELGEELEYDDDSRLYNFSVVPAVTNGGDEPIVFGAETLYPQPIKLDSIEIEILADRGQQIYDFLSEGEVDIEDFKDFIKGFKITTPTVGCVLGFKPEAVLRVYYDDLADETSDEEEVLEFGMGEGDLSFNHIEVLRSGTLDASIDQGAIASSLSAHRSYVQSGLGLGLRLDLPYIREILARDEELLLDKVEIELMVQNEFPEELAMLQTLAVYRVDEDNDELRLYEMPMSVSLNLEYGYDRYYTIDITEFVEEQLELDTELNEDGLLIRYADETFNASLNHLILADQQNSDEKSKIKLNVIRIK
ncbi:hypothetical protein BFP72_00185 [Reichenbachiella sp. 5M10]|uniref:DUF4270 family protein n=1 Tax=Reichenbachiella sp. 5M10 TaxID=1889772 RepID=UPI000C157501|nr:DUF4270 family protein [Reichenbachiella sp. 5M10]PIB33961.1 hypothetical protein BFP72_00185 [Reichenbachiella sp. 5M10]